MSRNDEILERLPTFYTLKGCERSYLVCTLCKYKKDDQLEMVRCKEVTSTKSVLSFRENSVTSPALWQDITPRQRRNVFCATQSGMTCWNFSGIPIENTKTRVLDIAIAITLMT